MATTYDAFAPLVAAAVGGCPEPVIMQQAKLAVIEFCRRARVWVVDHAPINVVANTASYTMVPPVANTVIVVPLNVFYDTKELKPKTREWLTEQYGNWKLITGLPSFFTQDNPRALILVGKPTDALANGLNLQVALKPAMASTGFDDNVFEDHAEDIVHGVKWRIFAMKDKSWGDAELARVHLAAFEDAIAKAALRAAKGFARARMRSPAHFF